MKSIKIIYSLLLTLLFLNQAESQVTQEWVARYSGTQGNTEDMAFSIAVDDSGNVYVTGHSAGIGTGSFDYATIKYNSSGVQQWEARYNGTANSTDYANAITVDGLGNVFVTGASIGAVTGNYDFITIKYNASGVQQWVMGQDYGWGRSIAVDGSGNIYVTGQSLGNTTGSDYTTIKYNTSGVQLWISSYNGPGNSTDDAYSLALDGSGNVYVTGESASGGYYDYATVKYDSSGVQQWVSRYTGPVTGNSFGNSIKVDPSGNVYVTGQSQGNGSNYDYATIKYNSSGDSLWVKRYNGPGNAGDVATSLALDGLGNVYVTGYSSQFVANFDYATIKYNSSGDSLWVKRYNGSSNYGDYANAIAVDGSGNVYVTGYSRETTGGDSYTTIKYNSSGIQNWLISYNAPGSNGQEARSIAVDVLGNVYVSGYSATPPTFWDYATIKYVQTVNSVDNSLPNIPDRFVLEQNYPNPFNPSTAIKYSILSSEFITLKVFDVLGNEVAVLVNEEKSAGSYEVEFSAKGGSASGGDASSVSSGIYFYKLQSESFVETKKMILLR